MTSGYEIGIYLLSAFAIILSLFTINWVIIFYKLWRMKHIQSISIRRPTSVLLFGILCGLSLLIRNPFLFYLSLYPILYHKLYFIFNLSIHLTTFALVYILVYRTWLVFYDIKWNQALEDEKWQSQINTDTLKQSWYIKNRLIYGNQRYVKIILFIPWFLFCSIGSISILIKGRSTISLLFYALNLFIPIIMLIILSCMMPTYNDYYKLRIETRIASIVSILSLISMVFVMFALSAERGQIQWIFGQFIHISFLFILSVISFYWVFKQFNLPIFCCYINSYRQSLILKSSTMSDMRIISHSVIDINKEKEKENEKWKNMHLYQILNDEELFKLFATHIAKEFSIENLLFFVESHQFIQYIIEKMDGIHGIDEIDGIDGIKKKNTESGVDNIELTAKNIPKSTIVQDLKDNKAENSLNIAAINLFLKYIDNDDAYFLINISSSTRNDFYEIFGLLDINGSNNNNNKTKKELMNDYMIENKIRPKQIYDAFRESQIEIFRLLTSSFTRFRIKMMKQNKK